MDWKKVAAGFRASGFMVNRVLPASVLLALMVLLAILVGCQKQLTTLDGVPPKIRPARQTDRLVQNAEYLKKSGRLELAVEELEKARRREPENLEILDFLAHCYEDLGHFDRARELYDQALSEAGHHPALENNRCYSLYLQGRLDQAEACFRKVLRQDPDNQTARNNLGLVLCRQDREDEALALWREALNAPEARELLGQALTALGREMPPRLAALDSPSPDQQTAAAKKTAAASVSEPPEGQVHPHAGQESPATAQTQPVPVPLVPTVSQNQNLTIPADRNQNPPEKQEQLAAREPAPAAENSLEQQAEKKAPQPPASASAPKPATPAKPLNTVAVSKAGKEPPAAAADTSTAAKSTADAPHLTALDLAEAGIELKNGNGVQGCARTLRKRLRSEGFNVVSIGNHIDFGLEETIIAYRSDAARLAEVLAQKFFPEARLEAESKTSSRAAIRVYLGHDLEVAPNLPAPSPQKVAALDPASPAPAAPVTEADKEPAARAETLPAAPAAKVPSEPAAKAETPPTGPTQKTDTLNPLATRADSRMRIELRNGNGVPGQARNMRRCLWGEGFKVINIGNCKDYGLEETVIAYRPEAAEVAQILSNKFFSGANLEEKSTLPFWLDIRVLLGQDLVSAQEQLAQMSP